MCSLCDCYLDPQSQVYLSYGSRSCETSIRVHGHQVNVVELPQELEDANYQLFARAFAPDYHLQVHGSILRGGFRGLPDPNIDWIAFRGIYTRLLDCLFDRRKLCLQSSIPLTQLFNLSLQGCQIVPCARKN